jgi:hypothetical protein
MLAVGVYTYVTTPALNSKQLIYNVWLVYDQNYQTRPT